MCGRLTLQRKEPPQTQRSQQALRSIASLSAPPPLFPAICILGGISR